MSDLRFRSQARGRHLLVVREAGDGDVAAAEVERLALEFVRLVLFVWKPYDLLNEAWGAVCLQTWKHPSEMPLYASLDGRQPVLGLYAG